MNECLIIIYLILLFIAFAVKFQHIFHGWYQLAQFVKIESLTEKLQFDIGLWVELLYCKYFSYKKDLYLYALMFLFIFFCFSYDDYQTNYDDWEYALRKRG